MIDPSQMRITRLIICLVFAILALSCENKMELVPKSDFLKYPSLSGKDIITVTKDSGNLQLILRAPLMEQYNLGDNPYSEFRQGMKVDYFKNDSVPAGSVSARYAKYTEKNKTWELRDSVVVINDKNEKLETELLYWDQDKNKDLIYTDRFVKISTATVIMQGIGFESDSKLTVKKIKKVSAEIYPEDEE